MINLRQRRAGGARARWAWLGFVACFSVSCGDDDDGPKERGGGAAPARGGDAAKPAAGEPAAVAAAAPAVTANPYDEGDYVETEFDVTRDPFRSRFDDVKVERGTMVESGPVLPLTPLQQHSLGELGLVGIVTGQGLSGVALLAGRGGKSYLVRIGDKIGPPPGRVAQIMTDRVIVKRIVTGPDPKDGTKRVDTDLLSEITFARSMAEEKE